MKPKAKAVTLIDVESVGIHGEGFTVALYTFSPVSEAFDERIILG